MKKFIILTMLFLFLAVPSLQAVDALVCNWMHISKYTSSTTLVAPYFIMRRGSTVWQPTTGTWVTSGSTYASLDIRPVWDANGNIFVFTLPQNSSIGSGIVSLILYDAADGAEVITDVAIWGCATQLEVTPDDTVKFLIPPVIY